MKQIQKVLLLGSGGLRIGQAGEFDYSGSQAIKALRAEGIEVVLVNPNIATVQTDPQPGVTVYLQPLNIPTLTSIIEREKPDAILLSFGGQTALNLGLALDEKGILQRYNVKVLGSSIATIRITEDRDLFKQALAKMQIKTPQSISAVNSEQALQAAEKIGYPVMLRSGYSLGGLGSGIINNAEELAERVAISLSAAPQVLIEEYLLGWKEFEYEIVRDQYGNTLTICNMENLDPMGIHTGESIVVAPAQTLNNQEHQHLRQIALKTANHLNIIGECNIQYAVNPKNGDYRVIEVNARLSRSSALASKATGYPLAFVATQLALGKALHKIKNNITEKTCAYFEPALDYIVVKIPRWDIHKLTSADRRIGSEMKSVGEVMAIGRTFPEGLQKAVSMLNLGATCLADYPQDIEDPQAEISHATDRRLFALFEFFKRGGDLHHAHQLSLIDPWFLQHIHAIAKLARELTPITPQRLHKAKQTGFSDRFIAKLNKTTEDEIRKLRLTEKIIPYVKRIDTLAGECDTKTNYLYLTYHGCEHDLAAHSNAPIIVLGSGPYSIGSSVEFDWCAVNSARILRRLGEHPIIINSNPETVSTDYDESERLYFEPLTLERVQDIAAFESPKGIIVSVGGQIANNLAMPLKKAGYAILGTDPSAIDQAENREKFASLLTELNIDQPPWQTANDIDGAKSFAAQVGYPVLIRPSYILSGSAMRIVFNPEDLERYLLQASRLSPEYPVVISKFIQEAKELEIDGIAEKGNIIIEAISEHIENAGVHSGDATIVLPPQRLYLETIRRTKQIARQIVKALNITGPFNMQFIAKNNQIGVIECNLRASRSLPFVSKATGYNFIQIAIEVILNRYKKQSYETLELDHVAVKTPQFSYHRLKGADPIAHVEMASTGEVACLGNDLLHSFFNSWLATEQSVQGKRLLVSIAEHKKDKLLDIISVLAKQHWEIYATAGTHYFLNSHGIESTFLYKASEKQDPNITSVIAQRSVDLIVNIPQGIAGKQMTDGFIIRRLAIDHHIPLITNLQSALIILQCLAELNPKAFMPKSWQEYLLTQHRTSHADFI